MGWQGKYGHFLTVLRASLNRWPEPVRLEEADWEFVFDTACRHCMESVLFDYVKDLPADSGISPLLAAKWYSASIREEKNYAAVAAAVDGQRKEWREKGIDAVLLKGLECSAFYPVPEHRSFGDIDWWMRTETDWNKALDVLKGNGIRWRQDSDGDISYSLGNIPVEHHRRGPVEDSPEGTVLYLAEHVFHHAAVYGVGLRQICDYALASGNLPIDGEKLFHMARKEGLDRWLGLLDNVTEVLMDGSNPDRRTEAFLKLVLADGNFGEGRISLKRMVILFRSAPQKFFERWAGLAVGRIKRFL